MAKVLLNANLAQLKGAVGNWVFKVINGQLYATQRPPRKRKGWKGNATGTPKQVEWRNKFHHATRFAKEVKKNPVKLAFYLALAKKHGKRLRDICLSDYFSTPKIEAVDLSQYTGKPGSKVRFKAYETYPVAEVLVWLFGSDGDCDSGKATGRGKTWTYTATKTMPPGKVRIEITATDHASQSGTRRAEWSA